MTSAMGGWANVRSVRRLDRDRDRDIVRQSYKRGMSGPAEE